MVERLVLAVDGGPASSAAVEWVVDRARRVPLTVEVVTVMELGWHPPGVSAEDYRGSYERAVDAARNRLSEAVPDVKTRGVVARGEPLHELVAASRDASLLVIGSNKTSPVVGFVWGTLPLRIAAHAHSPVAVVPAGWGPAGGLVVVGVDGTANGNAALAFGAAEAEQRETGLLIIHAWSIPPTLAHDLAAVPPLDAIMEAHESILSEAADSARAAHPAVVVERLLERGPAAQALAAAAASAALLVVGSHGRGRIGGLILGSVGHDLLLNMPCPVAVIPPVEHLALLAQVDAVEA